MKTPGPWLRAAALAISPAGCGKDQRDALILRDGAKLQGAIAGCDAKGCTVDGKTYPREAIEWIGLAGGRRLRDASATSRNAPGRFGVCNGRAPMRPRNTNAEAPFAQRARKTEALVSQLDPSSRRSRSPAFATR